MEGVKDVGERVKYEYVRGRLLEIFLKNDGYYYLYCDGHPTGKQSAELGYILSEFDNF